MPDAPKRGQHGESWDRGENFPIDAHRVKVGSFDCVNYERRAVACVNALDGIGFDDVDAVREFIEAWDNLMYSENEENLQQCFSARARIHLSKMEATK